MADRPAPTLQLLAGSRKFEGNGSVPSQKPSSRQIFIIDARCCARPMLVERRKTNFRSMAASNVNFAPDGKSSLHVTGWWYEMLIQLLWCRRDGSVASSGVWWRMPDLRTVCRCVARNRGSTSSLTPRIFITSTVKFSIIKMRPWSVFSVPASAPLVNSAGRLPTLAMDRVVGLAMPARKSNATMWQPSRRAFGFARVEWRFEREGFRTQRLRM